MTTDRSYVSPTAEKDYSTTNDGWAFIVVTTFFLLFVFCVVATVLGS